MTSHALIASGELLTCLPDDSVRAFAAGYPAVPARLRHALADHPLLSLEALAGAAPRMRRDDVECRASDNRREGGEFTFQPELRGGAAQTIRDIAGAGRWVMLRDIEQLPEYAALVEELLEPLRSIIADRTGPIQRMRAFVFVSSPGTHTPVHFDPEHNVLFQIAGAKLFATCPAEPPFLPHARQEHFHASGDNLLAMDDVTAQAATVHRLLPGDALHVPFKAPHWVDVEGAQPSVSLSITWTTAAAQAQNDAWCWNAWARRHGLSPGPVPQLPARPWLRAGAMRLLRRCGQS